MMKSTATIVMAVFLALTFQAAGDDGTSRVYRASKPYWWDSPMGCRPPNDEGAHWCGAGAWDIPRLTRGGYESAIAASGAVGYHSNELALSITIYFGDRDVTFTCAGHSKPLEMNRRSYRTSHSGTLFEYWTWAPRAKIEGCLQSPIKMTVDGETYRLDPKLLREAAANATERAGS